MMQPLPTKIFDWVDPKDFNLDNYSDDSPTCFFFDFDVDYPDKLHNFSCSKNKSNRKNVV